MNSHLLLDIWLEIQDNILPAKKVEVAEKLLTTCIDYGLTEDDIEDIVGEDKILDHVIKSLNDEEEEDEEY